MESYHRFYALLRQIPYKGAREELKKQIVLQYTLNRTEHLHEMTDEEYMNCCGTLEKIFKPDEHNVFVTERKKRRSRALHQLQLYGVDTTNWDRVNEFCKQARIAGKEFRCLDFDELDALTTKMRAINRKRKRDGGSRVPPSDNSVGEHDNHK